MQHTPPSTDIRWFHDELKRGWAAAGIAAVPTVMAVIAVNGHLYQASMTGLSVLMFLWTFYGLVYSGLTWRAFRRISAPQLRSVVQQRRGRTGLFRALQGGSDGPESAVLLSVVAFVSPSVGTGTTVPSPKNRSRR